MKNYGVKKEEIALKLKGSNLGKLIYIFLNIHFIYVLYSLSIFTLI